MATKAAKAPKRFKVTAGPYKGVTGTIVPPEEQRAHVGMVFVKANDGTTYEVARGHLQAAK